MTISDEKKQLIEELRKEWRMMWRERIDDKVRAEGISDKDYFQLFVERGTVIIATRKFKPPDFVEILQQHQVCGVSDVFHPSVGGWGKFIRTSLRSQQSPVGRRRRSVSSELCPKKVQQQKKKGGRGWLHFKR